jgi:serine/threonine-protein kinase
MDSSPVDEAWETDGAAAPASDPPPSSQDHRSPLQVIADLRHPHLIVMRRSADGAGFEPEIGGGMSLAELSRSEAGWFPLPLRVGLRILLDALSGLAAIHQATQNARPLEFVHGELAPSNIYVGTDGVGRLTPVLPAHWNEKAQPGPDVTGYIAPERLLGDVFGQPADVFSAGVLLWEAITGKPLFRNWPLDAIVTQLIGRKVPYPIPFGDALWGVPLADVAMRALLVDPAERWNHVGALGAQIETIARGHLASSDEIAALVAGFAAGKGRGSMTSISDVPTLPPPPPPSHAESQVVTSLSPTASSIQSPPVHESVAQVELPLPEPAPEPQRWEAPATLESRVWVPTEQDAPLSQSNAVAPSSSDVADSWSGVAPPSAPGLSRRSKAVVWTVVSASLAITAVAAYRLYGQRPEARSSSTVLAPKVAAPTQPPVFVVGAAPAGAPAQAAPAAPPAVVSEPGAKDDSNKPVETPAALAAPAAPTSVAGSSAMATPAVTVNRPPPRPIARPAPPPPPPPAVAAPRAAPPPPPPSPPPAPKPKPKEDIFGI